MAGKTHKINIKKTTLTKAFTALALFSLVGINLTVFSTVTGAPAGERGELFLSIFPITSVASNSEYRAVNLEAVRVAEGVQVMEVVPSAAPQTWPDLRVIELNYKYVQLLVLSSPESGKIITVKTDSFFVRSYSRPTQAGFPEAGAFPVAPQTGFLPKKVAPPAKIDSIKPHDFSNDGYAFLAQPKVTALLC
jgi:hypothetical protein